MFNRQSITGAAGICIVAMMLVAPAVAVEFSITSLGTTGASVVDHNALTGDDRGGIAVSNRRVFYTGDTSTARFALADLSSAAGIGAVRDSLVSDLATGQVYLLANGSTPLGGGGGTATALLEIDGTTGALTGGSIALSSAISLPGGTGIFSGWGRIILHNTANAYNVDLPTGTVTDLGAMSTFSHNGCENWAYWGVAEEISGVLWIAFVENSATIARRRVPDGSHAVVASFANLSDMCSFTVVPALNRWYFHHEGSSQFGGSAETVGYASATTTAGPFPDGDGDTVADVVDNCPVDANPTQIDSDGDALGDTCDPCFGSGPTDGDGDLVCDGEDNCPTVANPLQDDGNGDDVGDACSPQVAVGSIVPDGASFVDATASATSPVGLPLTGNIYLTDCASDVTDLTFTWLATSCSFHDTFELTINGSTVATPAPDPGGIACICSPGISTLSVPLASVHALLVPGVNQVGVRKGDGAGDGTAFAWMYATITVAGVPQQVDIFDQAGGGSYGNPDLCGSSYTFSVVDTQAATPSLNPPALSQPWSGSLPCAVDISSLSPGCYALTVTADDGVVGFPSFDRDIFTLGPEATMRLNGGCICGDGSLGVGEQCDDGNLAGGDCCAMDCSFEANGSPCPDDGLPCSLDVCDGGGTCAHPAGNAGTPCRAAADLCDAVETCDGAGTACPADGVTTAGVTCRVAAGDCDLAEQCDGGSPACPADLKSTAVCRAAAGVCDAAESCDGAGNTCPADADQPDGTPCPDGQFCNGAEQCVAGSCDAGAPPCALSCDEGGDACTVGCPPVAQSGCLTAAKSLLLIKDKADDTKDKLIWKWIKGGATALPDFGAPNAGSDYALCVYAGPGEALIAGGEAVLPAGAGWTAAGGKGWKYDAASGLPNGIAKAVLKSGDAGKSKALVKGKGGDLPDPTLPIAGGDFPLLVQLLNDETPLCLESSFASGSVKKNADDQLKLKTP